MAEDKRQSDEEPDERSEDQAASAEVSEELASKVGPETVIHVRQEVLEESEFRVTNEGEADAPGSDPKAKKGAKKRIGAWLGKHTKKVVSQLYESRVDDIEHRARRAVSSAYEDQADDLEERAVRAMRTALTEESDRIKEVIEHAIQIKKREVRLSLLVLVVASLLYLLLYWVTR